MAEWAKRYRVKVTPIGWNVGVDEVVDSVDLAASLAELVGAPHRYPVSYTHLTLPTKLEV